MYLMRGAPSFLADADDGERVGEASSHAAVAVVAGTDRGGGGGGGTDTDSLGGVPVKLVESYVLSSEIQMTS